jgi:DNA-binding beta-propeller fold protein YncE
VGIAWESGNVYWVVDGMHGSLTRYDFGRDHGPGGEDHSDGEVARYVEGQLGYERGVPSHVELDHDTGWLYVADAANGRVVALDPTRAPRGRRIFPNYDGSDQYEMTGGSLTTIVAAGTEGVERPSGLALGDGLIFVTDNATSTVFAFKMDGALVDWVDLSSEIGEGQMTGIAAGGGALFVTDTAGNRVLRISRR